MLTRLLRWLRMKALDRAAYRRARRRGRLSIKRDMEQYQTAAIAEADKMVVAARTESLRIRNDAREDGYDEGKRKGYAEGWKEGLNRGKAEGADLGYREKCRELGLLHPRSLAEASMPDDSEFYAGLIPNVYDTGHSVILRIVVNGERTALTYSYPSSSKTKYREAVFKAVMQRERLCPSQQNHDLCALVQEVALEELHPIQGATFPTTFSEVALVCEGVHRRLSQRQVDLTQGQARFYGDDPEDLFQIQDTSVLIRPWVHLFDPTVPARFIEAFAELGLGSVYNPPTLRTIRDLLLITPEELRNCYGIGRVSVEQFTNALHGVGLALWGETLPETPLNIGERNFRAIHLD